MLRIGLYMYDDADIKYHVVINSSLQKDVFFLNFLHIV